MKDLKSPLFADFEKSKISDYSKVFGGILYTYHSTSWNGNIQTQSWDSKEDANAPEVATRMEDDSQEGSLGH